jgi:hypothetical protein
MRAESSELSDRAIPGAFDMMPEEIAPELNAIDRQRQYDQRLQTQQSPRYNPGQDTYESPVIASKRAFLRELERSERMRTYAFRAAVVVGSAATAFYLLHKIFE